VSKEDVTTAEPSPPTAAGGVNGTGQPVVPPLLVRETIENQALVGERALWHDRRARMSYAACNEASFCELRSLRLGPGKRLFCVTAGGGRVLDLVAEGPDEVWAVDLNPSQNHLLELKVAGIRALTHGEFLEFLGVRPQRDRLSTYGRLRGRLSDEARRYFDARPRVLAAGVIYQGLLERFLARVVTPLIRLVRPFWVRRLMAATTLAEQQRLVREPGTRLWRALLSLLVRPRFLEWFSGEAGFWNYYPVGFKMHTRMVASIFDYLETHLARDNHLVSLVFCGRYINEQALPPYLQPDTFARLQTALGHTRLRLVTGTVGDALHHAPAQTFDAFSLSDINSYLDDVSFAGLFEQVLRTARKGARLCSRGILYHRDLPAEVARHLRREPELERAFARDDMSMVHAFVVGELA
jgi:S-adenosylmethionine-diacylglycerol 3-amino-3-carboxypropyl transferase